MRRTLRECKLCLVPAGITPSSRRFYEAIVAKCIPLVLADAFVPAYTALLPLEGYAVRAEESWPHEPHACVRACAHAHIPAYTHAHIQEARPDELPRIVHESLQRWPQLYQRIERVRSSFVYGLAVQQVGDEPPAVGHAATCDATHAMLSDLQARFPQRAAHAQHMPGYGACLRPPRGARRPPTPCHKSLT